MKRRTFIKQTALAAAGLYASPLIPAGLKNYQNPDDVCVLTLSGTPRNRGNVYGETLKTKIRSLVSVWKDSLAEQYNTSPDEYIDEFVEKTRFTKAITLWTPGLLEEVKGIAESVNIDYKTFYAFQLWDEEWWFGRNKNFGFPVPMADKCSTMGSCGQKSIPSLLGQNLDIPGISDNHQVLLHIKHGDSDLESLVFTISGYIGMMGLNNKAVGVCVNALLQLNQRGDGLPVAYVVRGVLEQKSYREAVNFIHAIKHASGQNYIIGGTEKVASFECSANKVSRYVPYEGAKRVYHTNHPLVNDDQELYNKILESLPPGRRIPRGPSNSEIRFRALEKRFKNPEKKITVDNVKEALSSRDHPVHPVCVDRRESGGGLTAGSLVMELSESPVLHYAPGPPCKVPYGEYRF